MFLPTPERAHHLCMVLLLLRLGRKDSKKIFMESGWNLTSDKKVALSSHAARLHHLRITDQLQRSCLQTAIRLFPPSSLLLCKVFLSLSLPVAWSVVIIMQLHAAACMHGRRETIAQVEDHNSIQVRTYVHN